MENENFQILSNGEIKEINIINDYINNEEKKKELSETISVKDNDSNKMDTSYVFIRNNSEEEKKNLILADNKDHLNKGFVLVDEIVRREKLFISTPYKKEKQFKKLSFKEILINVNKLNKDARKRFKLKLPKRKSRLVEK